MWAKSVLLTIIISYCQRMEQPSNSRAGRIGLKFMLRFWAEDPPQKMFSVDLVISDIEAARMRGRQNGIYFDWESEYGEYQPYLRSRKLTPTETGQKLR
jgi:hypothetical protein